MDQDLLDSGNKKGSKTRGPKSRTALGNPIQQETPLDGSQLDFQECPSCEHMLVMQMDTVEAVKAANAQIQDTYDQALAAWSNAPKASRNKNPPARSRKCVAQTLACYCCLQNSMGKLTGFGCAVCVATVDAGGGYDKTCAVCSCPCKVVFYRHKRDTVARESSKKPPAQQYEPAEASVTSLLQCFRHDGYRETVLREEREKGFLKSMDPTNAPRISFFVTIHSIGDRAISPPINGCLRCHCRLSI